MQELNEQQIRNLSRSIAVVSKNVFVQCPQHKEYEITNFCTDKLCNKPLCPECIGAHVDDHFNSKKTDPSIETVHTTRQSCLKQIQQKITNYQKEFQGLEQFNEANMHSTKQNFKAKLQQQKHKIQEFLDQYFFLLERQIQVITDQYPTLYKFEVYQIEQNIQKDIHELQKIKDKLESADYVKPILRILQKEFTSTLNETQKQQLKKIENFQKEIDIFIDEPRLSAIQEELQKYIRVRIDKNSQIYQQYIQQSLEAINKEEQQLQQQKQAKDQINYAMQDLQRDIQKSKYVKKPQQQQDNDKKQSLQQLSEEKQEDLLNQSQTSKKSQKIFDDMPQFKHIENNAVDDNILNRSSQMFQSQQQQYYADNVNTNLFQTSAKKQGGGGGAQYQQDQLYHSNYQYFQQQNNANTKDYVIQTQQAPPLQQSQFQFNQYSGQKQLQMPQQQQYLSVMQTNNNYNNFLHSPIKSPLKSIRESNYTPITKKANIQSINYFDYLCQNKILGFFEENNNFFHYFNIYSVFPSRIVNNFFQKLLLRVADPIPRAHASVITPRGKVFLTGGKACVRSQDTLNHIQVLDFSTQSLELASQMIQARSSHSVIYFNNSIYLLCGKDQQNQVISSCEKLDLNTMQCSLIDSAKFAVANPAVATLKNRYIYKFGGITKDQQQCNIIERYDCHKNEFEAILYDYVDANGKPIHGSLTLPVFPGICALNSEEIVIFGGIINQNLNNKCYLFRFHEYSHKGEIKEIDQMQYLAHFTQGANTIVHENNVIGLSTERNTAKVIIYNGATWNFI